MFSIRQLALLALAIAASASAAAQPGPQEGIPKAEVAAGYSYARANATPGQCRCFGLNGGNAETALRVYRNFSAVAEITGDHASTTAVSGQSLSLLLYTGGPRFSYPVRRSQRIRITPFVQGLVGAVHGFDAPFPDSSGTLTRSSTALAVLLGGGVDIAIRHRFAIRAVQLDYGLNRLPNNANDSENLLRISTGVVFHIR